MVETSYIAIIALVSLRECSPSLLLIQLFSLGKSGLASSYAASSQEQHDKRNRSLTCNIDVFSSEPSAQSGKLNGLAAEVNIHPRSYYWYPAHTHTCDLPAVHAHKNASVCGCCVCACGDMYVCMHMYMCAVKEEGLYPRSLTFAVNT